MRFDNPDRSPLKIQSQTQFQTPTGLAGLSAIISPYMSRRWNIGNK
jgi:hypothetical protein